MQILVQRARIIALDEVEFYFDGTDMDSMEFCNPRIELEALHSILSLVDKILSTGNYTTMGPLRDLRDATVNMIQELGNMIGLETTVVTSYSCDKEGHLLEWGKNNGIQTKLAVAYVEGAGRGAIATEDLNVGDIALDIPISVIISEELVQESDMCPILEKVNGMSSETMLLLWSMRERHNRHSKFKLYFDSLPEVFNTGLSFGINAIMALDGTLLLEEIVQAKEHLRAQYDELFPALCLEHPHIFPADLYTWEQFLWACELWYSNSTKIMFADGKLCTCLVPVAGFLNHSLFPHIMHYGKVDAASNSLKFPLRRPCKAGEQCYLSYGKFSSSHLVTFYGFLPRGDNPYDIIPLDIDTPETGHCENGDPISDWSNHMVRGTWLSKNHGIFHYGLPTPLLDHFRRALCPTFQTNIHSQENLEIELQVLDDLHSTFENMLETFGETNMDESESWDMKLAMEFKALQRRIISSIVTSCNSGRKLVEQELGKWT
ncbi:[Fructose-bisphosphate aldolase]-lysine N-methyltransferase [Bertholletia excelsa]